MSGGCCGSEERDSPRPASCCGAAPAEAQAAGNSESSCCGGRQPHGDGSPSGAARRARPDFLLWGSLSLFLAGCLLHFAWPAAPPKVHVFGHACAELFSKAWWGVAFGILAAAVIGRVPRELVAAILGRGGSITGLFRAVGAGVLLDLCSHGILLVAMSLYRRGASLGQTLAFLIASPWNSLSLTLILAALIGWKWMLVFIACSMAVALATGWLADRLVRSGRLPRNPHAVDLPQDYRTGPALRQVAASLRPDPRNLLALAREGLAGSRMVLRWLLFGFVVAAAIRTLVPAEAFAHWFGPSIAGLLLTLAAATIIEVCSEGSSPIAADLITRAQAPGNAFVFLMAGAATDYTEILSLRETTRSWKTALFLPLATTPQVLLIGWLLQR